MAEFALNKRVYFIEAPIMDVSKEPTYFIKKSDHQVCIIQPYLPAETSIFEQKRAVLELMKEFLVEENISHYTMWTDTPKAMHFIRHLNPEIIIYDCLGDYSKSNPELEKELFEYADVVLTSGMAVSQKPETSRLKILRNNESSVAY